MKLVSATILVALPSIESKRIGAEQVGHAQIDDKRDGRLKGERRRAEVRPAKVPTAEGRPIPGLEVPADNDMFGFYVYDDDEWPNFDPTFSPAPTPAPIVCFQKELSVAIVTDQFAYETSWTLTNVCTGELQESKNNYSGPATNEYCVPEAQYDFTISDYWGDGICCSEGEGSYSVVYDGGEVASGGSFGTDETTGFGSCEPIVCLQKELSVAIDTDSYPSETSWTLTNLCTGELQESRSNYYAPATTTYCVPEAMYNFTIFDSYGDGVCCGQGQGSYSVIYDGEEVASGGEFGYEETTGFGSHPEEPECNIEMMKGNYKLKWDVYDHDLGMYKDDLVKANLRVKTPNGGGKGVMTFDMCVLEGENGQDSYLESMVAVTTGFARDSIISVLIGTSYAGEYNCQTEELMIGTGYNEKDLAFSLKQPAVKKDGGVGFPGNC